VPPISFFALASPPLEISNYATCLFVAKCKGVQDVSSFSLTLTPVAKCYLTISMLPFIAGS